MREHQYREGYARSLEGKGVEWDVKHMWEQVKRAMEEIAKEQCGLVRVRGKNPNRVWQNDEVKAAFRRKEVLAASGEEAGEDEV